MNRLNSFFFFSDFPHFSRSRTPRLTRSWKMSCTCLGSMSLRWVRMSCQSPISPGGGVRRVSAVMAEGALSEGRTARRRGGRCVSPVAASGMTRDAVGTGSVVCWAVAATGAAAIIGAQPQIIALFITPCPRTLSLRQANDPVGKRCRMRQSSPVRGAILRMVEGACRQVSPMGQAPLRQGLRPATSPCRGGVGQASFTALRTWSIYSPYPCSSISSSGTKRSAAELMQ